MTVAEGLAFIREFEVLAGEFLDAIDIVICPPFTAIWPLAQALQGSRLSLGGQNMAMETDASHTGEISAALLYDAGCRWVMLGHWEVRRHLGDTDETVNRKLRLALGNGLTPVLLIGEGRDEQEPLPTVLARRLEIVLDGCRADQVAGMAFIYEPEGAIGAKAPVAPEHAARGCQTIRDWLRARWGPEVAEQARILYGGSVAPEYASALLASADVDGLGASRRGRDSVAFADLVRQIARAKQ